MKTIGIIGGAGVIAANNLLSRIENTVTAAGAQFDQQHPEIIMLHATQAPSRSMWLEGRGPSFVPAYVDAANRLVSAGADVLAMCCNTAHAAYFELQAASKVPFINMVGETLAASRAARGAPVGVLCSDGTRMGRVYEGHAERLGYDMEFIYPDKDRQADVTTAIRAIKRGLHRTERGPHDLLDAAAQQLAQAGAGTIILACTELTLAFETSIAGVQIIDTVAVLADACLRESEVAIVQD